MEWERVDLRVPTPELEATWEETMFPLCIILSACPEVA